MEDTEVEVDCDEFPEHEECECQYQDDGDAQYDAWCDDQLEWHSDKESELFNAIRKLEIITRYPSSTPQILRVETEIKIVELMTGDKKNWKGWGERILDGVLTYEQHLEQKKSKHNPTWYADRLKKQEKLYEDYMKSLKEEKHWRYGGYNEIPKDSFSRFIRDAKLERDVNYI